MAGIGNLRKICIDVTAGCGGDSMNAFSSVPSTAAVSDLWVTVIKSIAIMSVVLGVLITVLFLMKRFLYNRTWHSDKETIKVLASCYIAPKQRIVLIDAVGEKILIGVTPQKIDCLAKISADCDIDKTGFSNEKGS